MAAILTRRPASSDGTARRQFQAGLTGDVGLQLMVTWKARFGLQKKIEEERRKKLQGKNITAPLLHRSAIITFPILQLQDRGRPPFSKIKKSPYFTNV